MSDKNAYIVVFKASVLIVLLCCCSIVLAKPVGVDQAKKVAKTFLKVQQPSKQRIKQEMLAENGETVRSKGFACGKTKEICDRRGNTLAYVTELQPEGYIITSADTDIDPILVYSFDGKFPFEESKQNVLLHLVKWDVAARRKSLRSETDAVEAVKVENNESWSHYTTGDQDLVQTLSSDSQTTWPEKLWWCPNCAHRQVNFGPCEECGKETEERGWITTQWHQTGRFNDKCPLASTSGEARCVVGCVATSMAQIINYWKYPSTVTFDSQPWYLGGDAYTSKGNVGQIEIDGDSNSRGFPSFDELNTQLSTINYDNDPCEEAYLCFAAGIKVGMNYGTESMALTWGHPFVKGFSYGSATFPLFSTTALLCS